MEDVETHDYFADTHSSTAPDFKPVKWRRPSFVLTSPVTEKRPAPASRMSTHRLDSSSTNFAQVLDDNGGPHGLRNLDIDYFKTVLEIFRDQKQHHSPVVLDFMLLHEINIHHLEHQLIAEWDWLSCALNQEEAGPHFANQAPRRLEEIRSLLQKYCERCREGFIQVISDILV